MEGHIYSVMKGHKLRNLKKLLREAFEQVCCDT